MHEDWRVLTAAVILCVAAAACGRVPLLPEGEAPFPAHDAAADVHDAARDASDSGLDARDGGAQDAGPAVSDALTEERDATKDAAVDAPTCSVPVAPVLSVIDDDEVLHFVSPAGGAIELSTLPEGADRSTAVFKEATALALNGLSGATRVLSRMRAPGCSAAVFDEIYDVRATYAPPPPDPTTTAVAATDPRIVGWAQGSAGYEPGGGVTDPKWMMPSKALGPVGTDNLAVVVLGDGGRITLTFGRPIADGEGWDFAVFENGFANDQFLELAFVEVSTDGSRFVRFDSAFRGPPMPCVSCSGKATEIGGLAGTYRFGYGTPFDLAALRSAPSVRDGSVDLSSINYVRIVDIVGDGATLDSFGRGIIDPLLGGGTSGFDLDAVGVLNQRP